MTISEIPCYLNKKVKFIPIKKAVLGSVECLYGRVKTAINDRTLPFLLLREANDVMEDNAPLLPKMMTPIDILTYCFSVAYWM